MPFVDFNTKKEKALLPGIKGPVYHSTNQTLVQIELEKGAKIPNHSHYHEQWTYVIKGELEYSIYSEIKMLTPGMVAFIPPNAPHSAKAIKKCIILECFHPVYKEKSEK